LTSALKQRVVGAIVLVALAVIFVPMLLDGDGRQAGERVAVEIPESPDDPDPDIETRDASSDRASSPSGEAGGGSSAQATSASASDAGRTSGDAVAAGSTEQTGASVEPAEESSADGPAAASDGASADGGGKTTASTANDGDGAASEASGSGESWAVQVASFGEQTNAIVLRDRLRSDGREAFMVEAQTESGPVWRVRIGPVGERAEAESIKRTVDRERGFDSLVVEHSS
jgi:DedD protein